MNQDLDPKVLRDRARRIVRDIRQGEPGERFIRYWRIRQRREHERPLRKIVIISIGFILVIAGTILGPAPFFPGIILGLPGLAILAARFRVIAMALDKSEVLVRKIVDTIRRKKEQKKKRS